MTRLGTNQEGENVLHNLKYIKQSKREIEEEIEVARVRLMKGLISKKEYDLIVNNKVNGRSRLEWLEYCDDYIDRNKGIYRKHLLKMALPVILCAILLFGMFSALLKPQYIGFVVFREKYDYTDKIGLEINSSYNYTWYIGNLGELSSVKLNGRVKDKGIVRVYLRSGNDSYLVFDSERLRKEMGIPAITGFAVYEGGDNDSVKEQINESELIVNDLLDNTSIDKRIIINALGGGSKAVSEVFEFKVIGGFNWDVDYDKICTKWEVNSELAACYGSSNCCAFLGIESSGSWNDNFYLSYERYGSVLDNDVSCQIVHYDVDLNVPYSDIVYSSEVSLEAGFYEEFIEFKSECVESCLLDGLNDSSYTLVIEVVDSAVVIDSIDYSVSTSVERVNHKPRLVKNISDIVIWNDRNYTIDLSEYFVDEDGDELVYFSTDPNKIDVKLNGSQVMLEPEKEFVGETKIKFAVEDEEYIVRSNLVSITVKDSSLRINRAPELVKDISNITMAMNSEYRLELSEYFYDEDELIYSYYSVDNLTINIDGSVAVIKPYVNFTGDRYLFFKANDSMFIEISNMFKVSVIEGYVKPNVSARNESTIQLMAVINKPVKWVKRVELNETVSNLTVNISSSAINVSVKKIVGDVNLSISEEKVKVKDVDRVKKLEEFVAEQKIEYIEERVDKLKDKKKGVKDVEKIKEINQEIIVLGNEKNLITGYAVAYRKKGLLTRLVEWLINSDIVGYAIFEGEGEVSSNSTEIIIEENVSSVVIEYETPGPESFEREISDVKKEVVVSSDIHYENILAYSELPQEMPNKNDIRLYRTTNNVYEPINFTAVDDNNNTLLDTIYWIVDSLSSQLYVIDTQAEFDEGTYNNTEYNSTGNYVQLSPGNTSGNYSSEVFNAGSLANWTNISWIEVEEPSQNWWDTSWKKRKEINITNVSSSTLSDFPAYVNVTYDSNMQADYDDLRFMNGSCDSGQSLQLAHEIENYTSSNAHVWVRIPALSTGTTSICMYYNNSEASSGENMSGVWDSNYKMVLHLEETTGAYIDSSGTENATVEDTPLRGSNGIIGMAVEFENQADDMVTRSNLDTSGNWAIEFWANLDNTGTYQTLWYQGVDSSNSWRELITADAQGDIMTWWNGGSSGVDTGINMDYTGWHYWSFVNIDGTGLLIYKDGVYQTTQSGEYDSSSGQDVIEFGGRDGSNQDLDGVVDEYRFSTTNRSADWINQSYQIVANQGTLVDFGSEEDEVTLSLNLTVRSCDDSACDEDAWNETYTDSPQNLSVANNQYFQYKAEFETDNVLYTPKLYNVTISYILLDTTPPNITLNEPVDGYNTTSQNLTFNFTANEDYPGTINCSLYINNVYITSNATTNNNTLTNLNASNIAGGLHYWNVTCIDSANNQNWSETRSFYIDIYAPTINSIVLNPNTSAEIDLGTFINISINATDDRMDVESVIFQYKRVGVDSNYTNKTPVLSNGLYITNITTDSTANRNYSYRVWSNDSFGNSNYTIVRNFTSAWDYTWTLSPSAFESSSGLLGVTDDVGTLIINNTGDFNLTFSLTHDWDNNLYYNSTAKDSSESYSIVVGNKSVKHINITATYGNTQREDTATITITGSTNATPSSNTSTATLVSYSGGAYLNVAVNTYPTTATQTSVETLKAKLRNIGNETAYNVTLNWTLPTGWAVSTGSINSSYSSLAASGVVWSNLTIIVSTLAPYDINATNTTITVEVDSNSNTSDSTSVNVSLLCNGADSICGTGCDSETDADCVGVTTTTTTTTTTSVISSGGAGGGGGGGGIVSSREVFRIKESSAVIEIDKGESNEFELEIGNSYEDSEIKDVSVEVKGFLDQYVKVEPSSIDRIRHGETRKFKVTINAPRYLKYGEYTLEANIVGDLVTAEGISRLTDKRTLKLIVHESKREDAVKALEDAGKAIEEMIEANFSTVKTKRLLKSAEELFEEKRYKQAIDVASKVIKKKEDAFTARNMLNSLNVKLKEGLRKGFKLKGTQELVNIALDAISKEEFSTAISSLKDAQLTYVLETKGKVNLIRFIVNNWYWLVLSLVVLVILLRIAYKRLLILLVSYRLGVLKKEQNVILKLKKDLQNRYFFRHTVGEKLFDQGMQQYEKRLMEIWHKGIKLRAKRIGFLSLPKQVESIEKEMKGFTKDLKVYQKKYFLEGTMPRARYFDGLSVYRRTLAELEKEKSVVEAKLEKEKGEEKGRFGVFVEKGKEIIGKFLKFKLKFNNKKSKKK